MKQRYPNLNFSELTRELGYKWSEMPDEHKRVGGVGDCPCCKLLCLPVHIMCAFLYSDYVYTICLLCECLYISVCLCAYMHACMHVFVNPESSNTLACTYVKVHVNQGWQCTGILRYCINTILVNICVLIIPETGYRLYCVKILLCSYTICTSVLQRCRLFWSYRIITGQLLAYPEQLCSICKRCRLLL